MIRNRSVGALGVLLLMGACASVPEERVNSYVQAFAEADAAGNLLYDEISPIIAEQLDGQAHSPPDLSARSLAAIAPASGPEDETVGAADARDTTSIDIALAACPPDLAPQSFEPCFFPERYLVEASVTEPAPVAARRLAIASITEFNAILARLNGGATAAELENEVEHLSTSIAALAGFVAAGAGPLGPAVGSLAGGLAAWAENLRADRELRETLVQGAPIVEELVEALIAETPLMFALKRDTIINRLDDSRAEASSARIAARDLVRRHAAPGGAEIEQASQRLNIALATFGVGFVPLTTLVGEQDTEPFDAAVAADLERAVARAEAAARARQQGVEDVQAFRAALGEYVRMLQSTRGSLRSLVATASPAAVALDPDEIVRETSRISASAREVRHLLRAL